MSLAQRTCAATMFLVPWAAGHAACVETLAAHGGDVDHNISHLGTPLYLACENQQIACARKLLESGKAKSTRNKERE